MSKKSQENFLNLSVGVDLRSGDLSVLSARGEIDGAKVQIPKASERTKPYLCTKVAKCAIRALAEYSSRGQLTFSLTGNEGRFWASLDDCIRKQSSTSVGPAKWVADLFGNSDNFCRIFERQDGHIKMGDSFLGSHNVKVFLQDDPNAEPQAVLDMIRRAVAFKKKARRVTSLEEIENNPNTRKLLLRFGKDLLNFDDQIHERYVMISGKMLWYVRLRDACDIIGNDLTKTLENIADEFPLRAVDDPSEIRELMATLGNSKFLVDNCRSYAKLLDISVLECIRNLDALEKNLHEYPFEQTVDERNAYCSQTVEAAKAAKVTADDLYQSMKPALKDCLVRLIRYMTVD